MAVLLIIMTVISVFSIVPITANAASFTTNDYTYQNVGGNFTAKLTNGQSINTICIDPGDKSPEGTKSYETLYRISDNADSVNRKMIRKILYYGYNGEGTYQKITYEGTTYNSVNQILSTRKSIKNTNVARSRWLALAWWINLGGGKGDPYYTDWRTKLNVNGKGAVKDTYWKSQNGQDYHFNDPSDRQIIYDYLEILERLPQAPPVNVWKSSGGESQRLIAWEFDVHILIPKGSTGDDLSPSMNNIVYTVTDKQNYYLGGNKK